MQTAASLAASAALTQSQTPSTPYNGMSVSTDEENFPIYAPLSSYWSIILLFYIFDEEKDLFTDFDIR